MYYNSKQHYHNHFEFDAWLNSDTVIVLLRAKYDEMLHGSKIPFILAFENIMWNIIADQVDGVYK